MYKREQYQKACLFAIGKRGRGDGEKM